MKKSLLIIITTVSWMFIQSQQEYSDVFGQGEMDREIQQINLLSHVSFQDSIYEGYNYEQYQALYKKANHKRIVSFAVFAVGAGLGTYGVVIMRKSIREGDETDNYAQFRRGLGITVVGTAFIVGGIVVASKSGKKMREYKREMRKLENDMTLSFAITNNGVGLVLCF
jgi:hypothetical protein